MERIPFGERGAWTGDGALEVMCETLFLYLIPYTLHITHTSMKEGAASGLLTEAEGDPCSRGCELGIGWTSNSAY